MPSLWIPRVLVFAGTDEKPQVKVIAARLGMQPPQVIGYLVRAWTEFQIKATEDGYLEGKSPEWLDLRVGLAGLAAAMAEAGWLVVESHRIGMKNFGEWTSPKATRRVEHAMRTARRRAAETARGGAAKLDGTDARSAHGAHTGAPIPDNVPVARVPVIKPAAKPDTLFDRFWSAYPLKKGKQDAARAWVKLKADEPLLLVVLEAVRRQSLNPRWLEDNGRFIPHPATWLNGRRWEDEPGPVGGGPVHSGARIQPLPGEFDRKRVIRSDNPPPAEQQPPHRASLFDE